MDLDGWKDSSWSGRARTEMAKFLFLLFSFEIYFFDFCLWSSKTKRKPIRKTQEKWARTRKGVPARPRTKLLSAVDLEVLEILD